MVEMLAGVRGAVVRFVGTTIDRVGCGGANRRERRNRGGPGRGRFGRGRRGEYVGAIGGGLGGKATGQLALRDRSSRSLFGFFQEGVPVCGRLSSHWRVRSMLGD